MSLTKTNVGAPATGVAPPPDAFRFGRNWQRYVELYLDPDRERIAADSLADLIGDLEGKTFVDIGCGSGLFSLCAYRAGARSVVSIDIDQDSVAATDDLRRRAGSPDNWNVLHLSILNPELPRYVDAADVVYSWGVLHHTGDMYRAIRQAGSLVNPGGYFAIAIYNRFSDGWLTSERWWHIKRAYNHASRFGQGAMLSAYCLYWFGRNRCWNPVRAARRYRRSRGMALWTDLVDWLGGYPYEFATRQEVVDFCETELGFVCSKVVPNDGTGNNEFVFRRPPAA